MGDRMVRCFAAALALVCVVVGRTAVADYVEVMDENGKRSGFTGKILEEKAGAIKFELDTVSAGQEKVKLIPVANPRDPKRSLIVRLEHRPKPTLYTEADSKFLARQYEEAYKKYLESYANDKATDPWVGPWSCYFAGEAAFREAKYDRAEDEDRDGGPKGEADGTPDKQQWYAKAAAQYGKLVAEAPDHYWGPAARVGLAQSQMRLGKFAEARQNLDAVAASSFPFWVKQEAQVVAARLKVEEADALKGDAARKKYEEAAAELGTLQKELMDFNPELAHLAMLGQGYAYQGKGDPDKAENVFEMVGLQSPNDEHRAEAFNSRGISLRKRGQPREALFSFLRVALLHFDIPSEHQKALYNAAWAAKEYYKDKEMRRAMELARSLMNKYPNGYYTKKLIREWNLKGGRD